MNLIAELAVGCNHDCAACPAVELGFQEDPKTGRLLKFPPGIGSQSAAPILLIGFNPGLRVDLQRQIMADRNAFTQLALNRLEVSRISPLTAKSDTIVHTRGLSKRRFGERTMKAAVLRTSL